MVNSWGVHPELPRGPRPAASVSSWAAAFLLALFFFVTSLYIASKRLFWFDEIATVLIARLPNVATMWKVLISGGELLPIPYYVIVRASETIFGRSEMAARLPCALGFAIGLLVTFDCTRRFSDGLHGFIAQAFLTCSFLPFYGYEARPYGLYFMFSALLLWTWLNGRETSKRAILGFGLLVFAATMVHFYAILCLTPLAAHDALRFRRPSLKLVAGCAGAGLALALLFRQILVGRQAGSATNLWSSPSLSRLQFIFSEFFPAGLLLLALIMILVAVVSPRPATAPPASDAERVGWLFLLIPFAGYVLAVFVTHAFYNRYLIGALPGIALAFACLLYRQFGNERLISYGIAILFACFGLAHEALKARHPELIQSFGDQQGNTKELIGWEDRLLQEGKPYTAVSVGNLVWLEAWYYSKHPERYVAVLESTNRGWPLDRYYSLPHLWTFDEFKRHAHESAFVVSDTGGLQNMIDAGLKVKVRTANPLEIFYLE